MTSVKMATLDLLKIKVLYPNFCPWHHQQIITWQIIVDVIMWPKFGNFSISMGEVNINWILSGFDQKNQIFEEWSLFKFNNLGRALAMALKFYTSVAIGSKLKVAKGGLFAPKTLNRVKWIEMGGFFSRFYKRTTPSINCRRLRHLTICT